jgi:hypothetical protein
MLAKTQRRKVTAVLRSVLLRCIMFLLVATAFELWFLWLNEYYDFVTKHNHSPSNNQLNHSSKPFYEASSLRRIMLLLEVSAFELWFLWLNEYYDFIAKRIHSPLNNQLNHSSKANPFLSVNSFWFHFCFPNAPGLSHSHCFFGQTHRSAPTGYVMFNPCSLELLLELFFRRMRYAPTHTLFTVTVFCLLHNHFPRFPITLHIIHARVYTAYIHLVGLGSAD